MLVLWPVRTLLSQTGRFIKNSAVPCCLGSHNWKMFALRCWLQSAIRWRNPVSRSCLRVCLTLLRTLVFGRALILLPWRRSDTSWQKSWKRWGRKREEGKWPRQQSVDSWSFSAMLLLLLFWAADVQLIRRGGCRSDRSSPADSRRAAPSRRRPEVCEECWSHVRPICSTERENRRNKIQ